MDKIDLNTIDWFQVLPRLGIDKQYLSKKHGPCPICGGKDRFRFNSRKDNSGSWICNQCGAGNGLTLVAKVNGISNREAFTLISDTAQVVPIKPYVITSNHEPSRDEIRSKLQKLWEEAVAVNPGDPVWLYLHSRIPLLNGDLPGPGDLRFHPALPYWTMATRPNGKEYYQKIGEFPAMLAKIRDGESHPVNIHRTYLTTDGHKANPGDGLKIKKMMKGTGTATGGAIRLFHGKLSGKLGVGEGIETMLGVRAAYNYRHSPMTVWSLVSAGMMRKFIIPEWVRELHIFSDNDPMDDKGRRPGQDAANELHRRALRLGIHSILHIPEITGEDFLDKWVKKVKILDCRTRQIGN
ncbi:MAG: toprim domain-containing protein [Pseudomonadota bacterium]|nr:toprim domain-containing protein [Pseudomonadota bacterium]